MTLDASQNFAEPLTSHRLFARHADLFPLQVLSGPIGRPRIHYEAPPAPDVPRMMNEFISWFNAESTENGLIRAAIAHLWFVSIHPFEDGNGRIARAIADLALAQDEQSGDRFYSLSAQIHAERRD